MAPRVWLATGEEIEAVTALIGGFRDWWDMDEPTDERIGATVATLIGDPATEFLLAAADGQDAGGVAQVRYRLSVWTGSDDCWLEDLFVRDDARRAGVGRALVTEVLERARARGCRRVELDVNEENTEAIAFYRGLGFSIEPKPPGRTLFVGRKLDR